VRSIEHGNQADNETLDLMAAAGAFLVPTLSTYHYLYENGLEAGLPPSSHAKLGRILENGLDCLGRAVSAGVRVAFGTDLIGGLHVHQAQEFSIRSQVLPMTEVIRSATTVGAELLGLEHEIGQVKSGYRADIIAVNGNPALDASVLANPQGHLLLVIRDGVVSHVDSGLEGQVRLIQGESQ
jgi:imidazolonepropionase-like amidohydrolase